MKNAATDNPIRNNRFFKYASTKRYLKIFVPEFAFKHDNSVEGKDKFVGRDVQIRRLFMWLTSTSRSGSYLITGYRGMGKSLLVSRVLQNISREQMAWPEFMYWAAVLFLFVACFFMFSLQDVNFASKSFLTVLFSVISGLSVVSLLLYKIKSDICTLFKNWLWKIKYKQDPDVLRKNLFRDQGYIDHRYWRIPIHINLGQEVLHERDVLGLIAQNIRDKYTRFVNSKQIRPLTRYIPEIVFCCLACWLAKCLFAPVAELLRSLTRNKLLEGAYIALASRYEEQLRYILLLFIAVCLYFAFSQVFKVLRKRMPRFSTPYRAIDRLNFLCERIDATINETVGGEMGERHLHISFSRERKKVLPIANVREIEQELQDIINSINSKTECLWLFKPQFIIVFDELDKISGSEKRTVNAEDTIHSPEFDTSVEGFTGTMEYEERKKNILHLLSNMKLFITSVKAKCVFISGHELFDASLADLSDREFAISSVFNGVLNVDSFLSPEREQNDVSSMTELYLSNILLPKKFLKEKSTANVVINGVPKKELSSLRWYYEYLTTMMLETYKGADEEVIKEKEEEIQFAVLFLRYFAVFLAHLCNGSPKKIASTLESYIKTENDTNQLYDWGDIITIGKRTEKNADKQCVLWFDSTEQRFVNFVHYIASPVMNSITNEVSHYGDKLLVTSSFILDQIYKYHSKGFSWRNLEQMPELLNANKNPELRDSMASIMEFQLQTHITNVSSGIHQYKFHKQIAEEITYMSMISEEASAIFNFTLNESSTVKRYNMRLFSHYQRLSKLKSEAENYQNVIGLIHENLGDIYSMDEDYYYAIMEYNNALSCIQSQKLTTESIITYLKCSMKLGNAYEYRRTYENAYMIYTQIINKLVHFREIEERQFGLEYSYRWTDDWRVKQPVLLDYAVKQEQYNKNIPRIVREYVDDGTLHSHKEKADELLEMQDRYNKNMDLGVLKDDQLGGKKSKFSQVVEHLIPGFSANLTPEKNDVIQRLAIFEDIDYIYQVIIAKLFLVEKMELGGISYSSLEIAESEFRYLHDATNMDGKSIIAADFFHKMASVLYYKNGYVTPPYNENGDLLEALYFFDCNIADYMEDYCLEHTKSPGTDAAKLKKQLGDFLNKATVAQIDMIPEMCTGAHAGDRNGMINEETTSFFKFLNDEACSSLINKIKQRECDICKCSERRKSMRRLGYKLPCNACKYTHRSLDIQLKHVFVDDIGKKPQGENNLVDFLRLASRRHVQHLRPSDISLLAHTLEQMGDIMLSCSLTRTEEFYAQTRTMHKDFGSYDWDIKGISQDRLTPEVIDLLSFLSDNVKSEVEREERIVELKKVTFTKIDRVLLYYWCASRFYEMGSLYKEAAYCVERVLKAIQGYLHVLNSSESTEDVLQDSIDALCGLESYQGSLKSHDPKAFALIHNLFRRVVRHVGRKFNNYGMGEITENKWLFHLERMDDVDLMFLSEYSDLKSAFLTALDIKVNCLQFEKRFNRSVLQRNAYLNWYREYLSNVYERVSSPLIHDKTFKEEILGYYLKAVLNKHILIDCLGKDVLSEANLSKQAEKDGKADFQAEFYKVLSEFIAKTGESSRLDNQLFHVSGPQERLQLVEFLIQDSIVCLSSILSILTPHNHYTSFSNLFMGDVYELLWEWSIYYESTYELYLYRRYDNQYDTPVMTAIAETVARNSTFNSESIEKIMRKCLNDVAQVSENKTKGGYQYSRLFMNIRHDIDDATIHHIFTNYAAETAINYYNMAKDINNEGVSYKNMIMGMYVLDDDLRNDTCQSNLADERFMLHCGLIERRRDLILKIYDHSIISLMQNYENKPESPESTTKQRIRDRQKDSIFINSEY